MTGIAFANVPSEAELVDINKALPKTIISSWQWQKVRILPGDKTGEFFNDIKYQDPADIWGDYNFPIDDTNLSGAAKVGKAYKLWNPSENRHDIYIKLVMDYNGRVVWYKWNSEDWSNGSPFVLEQWLTSAKKLIKTNLWVNKVAWGDIEFIHATKWYQIKPLNLEKLTIVDVSWYTADNPMMYKLKRANGEIGWFKSSDLSEYFYGVDPKTKFKWSAKIWSAIQREKVIMGMNATQVLLSWGEPDDINRTAGSWGVHEQWVYDYGDFEADYLYFENGKLTSVQN